MNNLSVTQDNWTRQDLTVYTGRASGAVDGKGNVIIGRSNYARGVVLTDSSDFPGLQGTMVNFLVSKLGRTMAFSEIYLPQTRFESFLNREGVPQADLIKPAMINERIKQQTCFFHKSRGLFFYDSSESLGKTYPFALAFNGDVTNPHVLASFNDAFTHWKGVMPDVDYTYHTASGYSGISGTSRMDFRRAANLMFDEIGIEAIPIRNLSLGLLPRKRVSCITLRDCVDHFARMRR